MSELPPQTLKAELCFAAPPTIDQLAILDAVRRHRPDAEPVEGERGGAVLISYGMLGADHPGDRRSHLLTSVTTPVADVESRDFSSSSLWPQAGEAFAQCRYSLLVTEFLSAHVEPAVRLDAFRSALLAVLATTAPLATWLPGSEQALPPEHVAADPLCGLVAVRTFPDADDPDVAIMDTLGLRQFGLTDLQCNFRYLDRELMAGVLLRNIQSTLRDGPCAEETVHGITAHQRWSIRRGRALIEPHRPALTIDPGTPFLVSAASRWGTENRHSAYD